MVTRVELSVIVKKIPTTVTTVASTIPAARDTLHHFTPRLKEFFIGAKSLEEMGFTY